MQPHIRAAVERIVTRGLPGVRRRPAERGGARPAGSTAATSPSCAAMQVERPGRRSSARSTRPPSRRWSTSLAARLDDLIHIGLGYLSLDRETTTLSGGESQRVKMVRHLGSQPHRHDVHLRRAERRPAPARRAAGSTSCCCALRDKGNTVLVVEHEPDVIAIADHVVDMGPRRRRDGGQVVYEGDLAGSARVRHADRRPPRPPPAAQDRRCARRPG